MKVYYLRDKATNQWHMFPTYGGLSKDLADAHIFLTLSSAKKFRTQKLNKWTEEWRRNAYDPATLPVIEIVEADIIPGVVLIS